MRGPEYQVGRVWILSFSTKCIFIYPSHDFHLDPPPLALTLMNPSQEMGSVSPPLSLTLINPSQEMGLVSPPP